MKAGELWLGPDFPFDPANYNGVLIGLTVKMENLPATFIMQKMPGTLPQIKCGPFLKMVLEISRSEQMEMVYKPWIERRGPIYF